MTGRKLGGYSPELRFKGYEEEWKKIKFSGLFEVSTETHTGLLPHSKTISIAKKTYKQQLYKAR